MDEAFLNSLTEREREELLDSMKETYSSMIEVQDGYSDSVINTFWETALKLIRKRDKDEATRMAFAPIFEMAGKEISIEDAKKIRKNMLMFAEKIFEVYSETVDEME